LVEMCPSRIAIMFNCFVIIFASYGYLYMDTRGLPSECTENALETRVQLPLNGKVKPEGKGKALFSEIKDVQNGIGNSIEF